jgi:hypothetical protein
MNTFLLLIAVFVIPFAIIFLSSRNGCFTGFECQWKITNCCPETAGANWECVNIKSYKETKCPGFMICPQFLSPKPNLSCTCENGECAAK